ncbi:palmitoyltransferase akr1 [Friedmanniomyces endolithicus]|nr:palmitoyltransferase akr1 [Friedmanniomyces endolithicus]KAK1818103.1 palmitoyltransferase akr1 [Friedmanniomyces endolithicus]
MASRDPSATPDQRKVSSSQSSSEGKDGLDKVELSDLDASPPRLPVEQDLMQLARLGELRSIQRLFDSGTYNAKSTDEQGISALHWAAINGHHALCHFLIQSGADVNARGGDAQATPVLWASKRCHLQVVSLLLANGADPLLKDDQGYNLLHSATLDGNIYQLILLLHQPNLSVDVPDSQGHTSLMWAAYKGFGACVDILLRWGADVQSVDEMGFTALHWALVKGNYVCIQKLVEYGSDRFARSKPTEGQTEGDTPAATAAKMKSERQWRKALLDTGFDEAGNPMVMPVPFVKDKRTFYKRTFFLWPFALGGLQLWMLATLPIWFGVPGVLVVGYALQIIVQKSLRWAPSDMKTMHKTPFLAGIFAGTLFWVGVRYIFDVLPWTFTTHPFLNMSFAVSYILCTYFYTLTMTADPGYVPKGNSRGQTKKVIDELIEHNAFDEAHFCTSCMIRKPLRSKHCRRCGRCVAREDHHCPWVDNCIGVNNHKHFVLYVVFLIAGIGLLIRLTIAYIEILPEPTEFHCSILKDALCAEFSKDPLTIITNSWGSLQLTWTFMLLFVHLSQIARNITTYETMRGQVHAGPLMTAVATGTISAEGAQVDGPEATADATHEDGSAGPLHGHGHKRKAKEGCLTQWSRLLGIDTFITIAFQGYKGSQSQAERKRQKKRNLWTRGVVRNCQDFWLDGPVMKRRAESTKALLGGEEVDYAFVYDVPKRSGMSYRGGYESVATEEGEV